MSGLKLWPVVVGVLIDIAGSVGAGRGNTDAPVWFDAISYLAVIPAAAFGRSLAGRGAAPRAASDE